MSSLLLTFFSKNTCELDSVLTRTIIILTTNELVKLLMLWTTGPWMLQGGSCYTEVQYTVKLLLSVSGFDLEFYVPGNSVMVLSNHHLTFSHFFLGS